MLFLPKSDASAVQKFLAGSPGAFEILVFRYHKKAYALARAQGVPSSSLDDVVQEAFLRAFRDLAKLESADLFGPWFLQIVRNTACRHLRRRKARENPVDFVYSEPTPAEAVEESDFRDYLLKKVERL